MTDKKILKSNPLLNLKNLEQIKNWVPWEPTKSVDNTSDLGYERYLTSEKELIISQEEDDGSHKIELPIDLTPLARSRKHLSDAAFSFANEVDFKLWIQRTVDDAAEE